jgi:hypothetical protein
MEKFININPAAKLQIGIKFVSRILISYSSKRAIAILHNICTAEKLLQLLIMNC